MKKLTSSIPVHLGGLFDGVRVLVVGAEDVGERVPLDAAAAPW